MNENVNPVNPVNPVEKENEELKLGNCIPCTLSSCDSCTSCASCDLNQNKTKDPWAGRSDGMKCKTCMYYVQKKSRNTVDIGRCRANAPTMKGYPVVYPDDWCGQHKVDEEKLLCG